MRRRDCESCTGVLACVLHEEDAPTRDEEVRAAERIDTKRMEGLEGRFGAALDELVIAGAALGLTVDGPALTYEGREIVVTRGGSSWKAHCYIEQTGESEAMLIFGEGESVVAAVKRCAAEADREEGADDDA
ncbi:MAG: hypothetical protein JNL82_29745 [Myxococcales bacterium]|nr:hypothetical protein [Myxococcales bacterium]